ncbi:roundabout homolog 3-like, partial [Ruditapes philippinarum]|uniref:roundabout homolog 3-like n=1 Tax=Ruditapes philippinarum TaxID=129788 RepID=UPI00295A81ED
QETVQIIEGGYIDILCDSTGYQGDQIYWESDNRLFHVDGNQLSLKAITRNQSGSYGCYSLTGERSDVIEKIFLDVLYPAKILTWDSPYSRLVQNDSYNMVVYIQGNPPPDQILLISNQTEKVLFRDKGDGRRNITLKSVQCGDSGTYHLYAVNDLDTDVFTKDITVYCVPYLDPDKTTQFEMRPRLGETIYLEMHSAGFPQPNFTWSFEGAPLKHTDDGYTSTVQLDNVHVHDFGEYQLDMENSVGKTTYFFHVIPSGPPEPPSDLTFIDSTTYSATLSWAPGYDYNSTQTFVIVDSKFNVLYEFTEDTNNVGNITTKTVDRLTPNHLYNVTIFARNKNGTSRDLNAVSFYTQESSVPLGVILGVVSSSVVIVVLYSLAIKYCSKKKDVQSEKQPLFQDNAGERKRWSDYNKSYTRYVESGESDQGFADEFDYDKSLTRCKEIGSDEVDDGNRCSQCSRKSTTKN